MNVCKTKKCALCRRLAKILLANWYNTPSTRLKELSNSYKRKRKKEQIFQRYIITKYASKFVKLSECPKKSGDSTTKK